MVNNNWVPVKDKQTHVPIIQTEKLYFKTNSESTGTGDVQILDSNPLKFKKYL